MKSGTVYFYLSFCRHSLAHALVRLMVTNGKGLEQYYLQVSWDGSYIDIDTQRKN